jgi:uncharacterized protein YdaU (DUF1376 family)
MKAPYFPLFVNNWLGSGRVSAMTPAEEGAYIRLLCYEWNDDKCSLPNDDLSLATLSRLGVDWKQSAAKLRAMFDEHDGRLYSEKLLSLRMEADTLREKKHSAGVKGMLSRWHNKAITKLLQNDNPTPTPTPTPTEQNKASESNTEKKPQAARVIKQNASADIDIPERLQTPEFLAAWEDWKQHRKEIKKPLTLKSSMAQMRQFIEWGPDRAVKAIEYTILKGWQGIQEPQKQGCANGHRLEKAAREYEEHIVVPTL